MELDLEPGTNSLCHVLHREKFRYSNLVSKHRQSELSCSSEKRDLLNIFTCPTELLTALLTVPFKVHVCKHLFKYEVRLGGGGECLYLGAWCSLMANISVYA